MRKALLLTLTVLGAAMLLGCSGGGDDAGGKALPPDAGKVSNPSGKLTEDQQKTADLRKQAGDAMGQRMAEAAKAEKEAKARAGG